MFPLGLAVMVLMIPLNGVVAAKMKKYQISQMKDKDRRVKLMDEILNGIKVLKLYAWERSFQGKVNDIRQSEAGALIKAAYLNAITSFLWTSAPFLVALASFATFVLVDPNNVLDANTAFVSLTLFNLLRVPLNILPMLVCISALYFSIKIFTRIHFQIVFLVQCQVSVERINKFMNADELDPLAVTHKSDYQDPVVVERANFSWSQDVRRYSISTKRLSLQNCITEKCTSDTEEHQHEHQRRPIGGCCGSCRLRKIFFDFSAPWRNENFGGSGQYQGQDSICSSTSLAAKCYITIQHHLW